jgi:hypothetical protein
LRCELCLANRDIGQEDPCLAQERSEELHANILKFGFGLTVAEGRRVLRKVPNACSPFHLLSFHIDLFLFFSTLYQGPQVTSGSVATPSPAAASSGGGADSCSAAVSSAAPSAQAASPHEGRTTDIT